MMSTPRLEGDIGDDSYAQQYASSSRRFKQAMFARVTCGCLSSHRDDGRVGEGVVVAASELGDSGGKEGHWMRRTSSI